MRLRSLYDWSRQHPYVLDVGIVVLLMALVGVGTITQYSTRLGVPVLLVLIVPLIWRRRHPVAVFTVISLACAAQVVVAPDTPLAADVGFLFALYALSAYTRRLLIRLLGLGVGLLGAALATLGWGMYPGLLENAVLLGLLVGSVWLLGDLMRTRRAYVGELEERARRLEIERDQHARIARSTERARIAREMHDVVAHSLSIVVAQADGGRYAGETDPEAAKRALETIGTTGRRALAEMRRLLGVLKSESANESALGRDTSGQSALGPDYAPQPGLDQLEPLLAEFHDSGLPTKLEAVGESRTLPDGLELAAYRVVQEALTNALKHGGPRVEATVRIDYAPERLRLCIEDDGRGAAARNDGAGHGLNGMRERVGLFGGALHAGPRAGGGYRVVAEIPF